MPPAVFRPCVFFDRDGVVNQSPGPGYVNRLEDFHILPGFVACVRAAAAKLGIYGNSEAEAVYPFTRSDANGIVLDGGLIGAWTGMFVDMVARAAFSYVRFARGKWQQIQV